MSENDFIKLNAVTKQYRRGSETITAVKEVSLSIAA
jgi:ABC-type methionine transport system ATPase subunit